MKKHLLILLPLCALFFAACDDDDDVTPAAANTNSNEAIASSVTMLSETSLNKSQTAQRLEMPALKGGTNNLFVVHTTAISNATLVNYAMEYDTSKRASRWTAYQSYAGFSSNDSKWSRNSWYTGNYTWNGTTWTSDPFQVDPLIYEYKASAAVTLDDHQGNNYDRGHMLASADRLNSMEANGQTFYLSNIHPQLNSFNAQGIWYSLEAKIRDSWDINKFRDTLYIVKGGTIDESSPTYVQGRGQSLIRPSYFYMALLCKNSSSSQGGYKAIAFWMEHKANTDTDNYADYAVSIDKLEELTGIDFFCNLPDDIEATVESNLSTAAWNI